ncbi:hypothetical protein HDU91_003491 [Kappamyces sp. JEL0680]|nr:hypothetical protein HDU91_003491 [Kappamyces sp. JEL0680]
MLDTKQQELKLIQSTFLEQTELLHNTSGKLEDAMNDLEHKKSELEDLMAKTLELQHLLQQQVAHAKTETELNQLAAGLAQTLKGSVSDIDGLHQKIERKSAIERANKELFEQFQSHLFAQFSSMASTVAQYQEACGQRASELKDNENVLLAASQRIAAQAEGAFRAGQEQLESLRGEAESGTLGVQESIARLVDQLESLKTNFVAEIDSLSASQTELNDSKLNNFMQVTKTQSKQVGCDCG